MKSRKPAPPAAVQDSHVPWLELVLGVSVFTLVLQLVPGLRRATEWVFDIAWWTVGTLVDVRSWTWKGYASAFAIMICVLGVMRSRSNG